MSGVLKQGVLDEMKFAKGHSKILMKNDQASGLDIAREKVLEKYALMLQRLARGFIVRRRLVFMRKVLKGLHEAIAKRSDALLAKWFAQVRLSMVCTIIRFQGCRGVAVVFVVFGLFKGMKLLCSTVGENH